MVKNRLVKGEEKLRIESRPEYYNQFFNNFCATKGNIRHKIVRLTPQQNGLAERMNRTLVDKVCMLVQVKLLMRLWAETLNTTCCLVNLSPSIVIDCKTLFKA